ncbi:hypothetical protein SAMN05216360_12744 [Methylobacterium phyllostachyos]|uniref:Helix-turn-helix domain-containing protein n=1 Tax=Methylobacterium phyllostachyos TaxID=582672 RepID=A0A1H0KJP5_9HYPH|nr:hypothetical protein SAMN05216360_12744 [Methylobacterium phyllostachyos]
MPEPTIAEIEREVVHMAYVVERYGERYRPILDSLAGHLEAYRRRRPSPERGMPKRPRQPREPIALEPRCLTIADAAAYCGLTPGGFRQWVSIGRLPPSLPGTHRWDRRAIDFALDRLSGLPGPGAGDLDEDAMDRWLQEHGVQGAEARKPDPNRRGPTWRRVPK